MEVVLKMVENSIKKEYKKAKTYQEDGEKAGLSDALIGSMKLKLLGGGKVAGKQQARISEIKSKFKDKFI
jgi:hypothetical protein